MKMLELEILERKRVDIDKPKFDMTTYMGRAKHFFKLTSPLNLFATSARLEHAKEVVTAYRNGQQVPHVESMEDIWTEKYLYDSAFHPDTGEKMFLLGRMSAQMPTNTFLTGCMVIFYKTRPQVLFFQWLNQTFNAVVNYTNRSGKTPISTGSLLQAYFMATFGALFTAMSLKHATRNLPSIFERLVPFCAVAAANCVNLPFMRQNELKNGIALHDAEGHEIGYSRKAAAIGIAQVIFSRVAMAVPCMIFTPIVVDHLEKTGFLARYPKWSAPVQAACIGFILIFSTPLGCALFRQQTSMRVDKLEASVRDDIKTHYPAVDEVYYNKGL